MDDPFVTGISICKSGSKTRFLHSDESSVNKGLGCEVGKIAHSTHFGGYGVDQGLAPVLRLKNSGNDRQARV
jgi:hypothetical protein